VEMDETYLGGKISGKGTGGHTPNKTCVVSLVERGGKSRSSGEMAQRKLVSMSYQKVK